MKRTKSVTTHYSDGSEQTVLRDTSKDCLADDLSAVGGVKVGNCILFADGSYRYGKKIVHRPAPLGGEFPLARPTAILRYWEAMHEELITLFNNLKWRLESGGHTFEIKLDDGKTVDAVEQLESLKGSIQEAESQYHKAEKALQQADPRFVPAKDTKLSFEQVKGEMDFRHKVGGVELGESTIEKPQRMSRR